MTPYSHQFGRFLLMGINWSFSVSLLYVMTRQHRLIKLESKELKHLIQAIKIILFLIITTPLLIACSASIDEPVTTLEAEKEVVNIHVDYGISTETTEK